MKIAFTLFSYFPYGGLQRDFLNILQACVKRKARITVFTLSWQGTKPDNVEIIVFPDKSLLRTTRRKRFVKSLSERTADTDFDVILGFNKMPGLDYYYAADSCFAEKAFNERSWLYRMTPRCRQYLDFEEAVFGSQSSTKVLLISPEQEKQFIRHYQIDEKRIIRLPPGIDRDRKANQQSAAVREKFREEFAIADDELLILQIGSGFSIKGVDRSLTAIASLPKAMKQKIKYFLVGDDKAAIYIALAKKLGIENVLTTFSGRDDIPRFLQGADILLHPAYLESAGLALLEAIVAGLPVLTTDTCGYAFHVESAKAGVVCKSPFRQEELNVQLLEMLSGSNKIQWRRNGIRYGETKDLYGMADKVADCIVS